MKNLIPQEHNASFRTGAFSVLRLVGAFCLLAAIAQNLTPARAATVTWDAGSSGGSSPTNPADGAGTWGTNTNWSNGTSDAGWTAGNNAVIGNGGTAGTITVSGGVSVAGITFNPVASGSYTIQSSSIALTGSNIVVNAAGATISSVLTGSVGLVKSGTGALTISALDTYSGGTTVNAGTLNLSNEGASGQGDIVGALTINSGATVNADSNWAFGFNAGAANSVTSIVITSGTLNAGSFSPASITMTGATLASIVPGTPQQWYGANSSAPTVTTNASTVTSVISGGFNVRNNITGLTFTVASGTTSSGIDLLVSGVISPASGQAIAITKSGAGVMALTAADVTTGGAVTINAGTLQLGNGGSTGSISSNSAVSGSSGGTLAFDETGSMTFSNTIGGGIGVAQNGGAGSTAILTGPNTYTGPTAINSGTLQIGSGATAGAISSSSAVSGSSGATLSFGQTGALSVGSAISGALGVTQLASGTTTLSGNSSYTGATSVAAGALNITGTLGNTSITVSSGASLGGTGLINGAVTVNGGGAINLAAGIGTLTLDNGLTIGNNSTASILDFAGSGANWDLLNDSASALNISGSTTVNLTALTGLLPGTYNLITFNSLTGSLGSLTLSTSTLSGKNVSLLSTGTSEELVVTGLGVYWTGTGSGNSWGTSGNWTSNAAGTSGTTLATSSPTLDVYYNANGVAGPVTSSLGASYDVNGLFFLSGATGGVSIGDATYGLTLEGDGITMNAGTGAVAIGVNSVTVNTSQTWANNSSSLLTVSSPVSGAAASGTMTLTVAGSGTGGALLSGVIGNGTAGGKLALVVNGSSEAVTLTASNTYSGGTTITSGTLQVGNGGTAGTLGSGAVVNNGTLVFNRSDNPSISNAITDNGSLVNLGSGTLTLSSAITDNGSLVNAGSGALILSSALAGSGSLTQSGSGTLTISSASANSYTGTTTVSAGTLVLNELTQTTSSVVITGGTLETNYSAFNALSGMPVTVGAGGTLLNIGGAEQPGKAGSPLLLTGGVVSGSNGDTTYGSYLFSAGVTATGGAISTINAYQINADATTFTVANGSTLAISSKFISNGFVDAGAGTLVLTGSTTSGVGLTINSGGNVQIGNGTTDGYWSGPIADAGALTYDIIGNETVAAVSGAGGTLTKTGGGAVIMPGESYTGSTTVNAGLLEFTAPMSTTSIVITGGTLETNYGASNIFANIPVSVGAGGTLLNAGNALTMGVTTLTGGVLSGSNSDTSFGSFYLDNPVNVSGSTQSTINAYAIAATNNTFTVGNGSTLLISSQFVSNSGRGFIDAGAGTMILTGSTTASLPMVINAGGTVQIGNGTTNGSWAGTIANSGALQIDTVGSQTVSSAISGAGSLAAIGSGTVTLSAASCAYSGSTTVTNGTLIASATLSGNASAAGGTLIASGGISGNVSVSSGGTFSAGNNVNGSAVVTGGTLAGANGITFQSNVTIGSGTGAAAGSSVFEPTLNSTGTTAVNFAQNLTLMSDGAYQFTLNSNNGTTDELYSANGTFTFTGALLTGLDAGSTGLLTNGTAQFVIADALSIVGQFANAANGSLINIGQNWYDVSYQSDNNGGQEVLLTAAVPEPGTWGTILVGFAMLVGIQRRRLARSK